MEGIMHADEGTNMRAEDQLQQDDGGDITVEVKSVQVDGAFIWQ